MTVTTDQIKELREKTSAGVLNCKKALIESKGDFEKAVEILRKKGIAQAAKREGREAKEGLIGLRLGGTKGVVVELNCETDFVAKTDAFKSLMEEALNSGFEHGKESLVEASFQARLVETSAKTGEKLQLGRVELLSVPQGVVAGYLHSNHRVGVLVAIQAQNPNSELEALGKEIAMQVAAMCPVYVSRQDIPAEWIEKEKEITFEQSKAALQNKPEPVQQKIIEGKLAKRYEDVCLLDQRYIKDDKKSIQQIVSDFAKRTGITPTIQNFIRYELGGSN